MGFLRRNAVRSFKRIFSDAFAPVKAGEILLSCGFFLRLSWTASVKFVRTEPTGRVASDRAAGPSHRQGGRQTVHTSRSSADLSDPHCFGK